MPDRPPAVFVDDEPLVLLSLRRFMGALLPDMEIVPCATGQEAIRHLESRAVDVLVTDIRMPAPTGVEILDFARRKSPATLRFTHTAYPASALSFETVSQTHGYFLKPSSPATLAQAIQAARAQARPLPDALRRQVVGLAAIPVLPETHRALEADLRGQAFSADHLCTLAWDDPALAANLMHYAFSVGRDPNRRARSLPECLRGLDLVEACQTLRKGLPPTCPAAGDGLARCQRLQIRARTVADRMSSVAPEAERDAYRTAGLLHNIGAWCLEGVCGESLSADPVQAGLGARVLELWGAAASLVDAVDLPHPAGPEPSALQAALAHSQEDLP